MLHYLIILLLIFSFSSCDPVQYCIYSKADKNANVVLDLKRLGGFCNLFIDIKELSVNDSICVDSIQLFSTDGTLLNKKII